MSKDYAKKASGKQEYRGKKQRTMPGWLWLCVGMAIGVVIAVACYVRWHYQFDIHVEHGAGDTKTVIETKQVDSPIVVERAKPKFDFYTVLPSAQHGLARRPGSEGQAQPSAVVSAPQRYFLQVAAFQNKEVAEALQAKLLLQGYDVNLESVRQHGKQWYRVSVGPFVNKSLALQQKQSLAKKNFNSIVLATH